MIDDYRVDVQLIEAINMGDRAAFDSLMMRYQPKVSRVIARYVKDAGDVMDLTQEVFMKAYQGIYKFRGESAFYTWLYRIAINTAKNYIMTQGRRLPRITLQIDESGKEKFLLKNTLSEQDTPESLMIRDEMEAAVYKVMRGMPKDVLKALTLRERDRFPYRKIAKVMKCRLGTVKSRIARARGAIDRGVHPFMQHE
jgi:RNA polymerase sigma-70 factor (ECF subfamily)